MRNLFVYGKNLLKIYKNYRESIQKITYDIAKYDKNQMDLNPGVIQPYLAHRDCNSD